MRRYRLLDVLVPGREYACEYVFGSTKHLEMRAVARLNVAVKGRARFELLARKPPPPLACGTCGKPAAKVCTAGCDAPEALACAACAADHTCGEDMLNTIVNSPRTGVCGYPTEPLDGVPGPQAAAWWSGRRIESPTIPGSPKRERSLGRAPFRGVFEARARRRWLGETGLRALADGCPGGEGRTGPGGGVTTVPAAASRCTRSRWLHGRPRRCKAQSRRTRPRRTRAGSV